MEKSGYSAFPVLIFLLSVLATWVQPIVGQTTSEVSYYSQYYGRYTSRYAGGTVTVELTQTPRDYTREGCDSGATPCGHWEGTSTARVSDLDLENVTIQQGCCDEMGLTGTIGYGFLVGCKGGQRCVSNSGRFTGFIANAPNMNPNTPAYQLTISCNTHEECSNFLNALKGRQKPVATSRTERPPPAQTKPSPKPTVTAPSSPTGGRTSKPPSDDLFGDILDDISWRNGSTGKSPLDKIAKKIPTGPKKPEPPVARPLYVAFAQSAGFDANDQYGTGEDYDLNTAISKANTDCVRKANTMCGDEGYCMLRPGLFGAWATDRKYLGGKAFACNMKTLEEAIDQAMAWCGFGCQIGWSGSGR